MELDENAKRAVHELGEAINAAIAKSENVAWAIENLRELGYEPNLQLKLEIGLFEIEPQDDFTDSETELPLEFTEEDLRTLRGMKISLE